jgi:hypothetical protein
LTPNDLDDIAQAIKRTGAGSGPSTPNPQGADYRNAA